MSEKIIPLDYYSCNSGLFIALLIIIYIAINICYFSRLQIWSRPVPWMFYKKINESEKAKKPEAKKAASDPKTKPTATFSEYQ